MERKAKTREKGDGKERKRLGDGSERREEGKERKGIGR